MQAKQYDKYTALERAREAVRLYVKGSLLDDLNRCVKKSFLKKN